MSGPGCLCGVGTSVDAVCPVHGSRSAATWLQPPPDMRPEPVPRAKRKTRADAMEEKAESRKQADEGKVHPGQCPRCNAPVLFARRLGLLYVVDAIPVPYQSTWQSMVPGRFYGIFIVLRGRIKALLHSSDVAMYKAEYVHNEHVSCGRVVPRLTEPEKPPKEDSDVPPFEGMKLKTWRCWDCRELIPPERQSIVISYDGPDMAYYYCHCDQECQPVGRSTKLGKSKVKYPKINPRTMKYEEPKKGEVLPE